MAQIKTQHIPVETGSRLATLRQRAYDAVKWWAEHQAWPATDEIRIEKRIDTCR